MGMTLQIHPGEYRVVLYDARGGHDAFAVVKALEGDGETSLFLSSVAACDALIRAAVDAKDKLIQATGAQVRAAVTVEAATGLCQYCDVEPAIAGNYCDACAAAVELATGTPVTVEDDRLCPAFTDLDECFTVFCDREPGHPGSHHGPGPDEGSEVAWSDEPEAPLDVAAGADPFAIPANRIGEAVPHCGARWPNLGPAGDMWTCTLDRGHDGDHEAHAAPGRLAHDRSAVIPQGHPDITWPEGGRS